MTATPPKRTSPQELVPSNVTYVTPQKQPASHPQQNANTPARNPTIAQASRACLWITCG